MGAMGTETLSQLDRVIAGGKLPADAAKMAEKLRDRLSSPLNVAILGVPGVGKSRVLELLAGEALVPEGAQFPVLSLVSGETPKTIVTTADGTKEILEGIDLTAAAELEPAMVEIQAPLAALKRISIMEVGIGLSRPEQARACSWAASRTDLAIWCTRDFGAAEQAAWATVPEHIKDQAILLRTRIDQAPNPRAALDRVDRLGRDEFDRVLAVNTVAALEARAGEEVDRKTFKASGGQALIAAVLKVVDRTHQAFVDQADLLLARHSDALGPSDDVSEPDTSDFTQEFDLVMAAAAKASDTETEASPKPTPIETDPADKADSEAEADAPSLARPDPATCEAFETAVARLKATGSDLVSGDAPPSGDTVLSRSVKDLTWLDEHLQLADGNDAALTLARNNVQEAVDMVQLMQIEKSEGAADDAVAIMLQLKRRFQQGLAMV